jgi:hypothetical protein
MENAMRILLLALSSIGIAFLLSPVAASSGTMQFAQVVAPPVKEAAPASGPRQLQQVSPPKQTAPVRSSTPTTKQAPSAIQAKSTLPTLEQENKRLKDEIAKQGLMILDLAARLDKAEKSGALIALRAKQLEDQVKSMTKPGGSLVRAYCDGETVSRNTAGAANNCANLGYACEPVSGTCYARCSRTNQCARGWVCDPSVSSCVRVN